MYWLCGDKEALRLAFSSRKEEEEEWPLLAPLLNLF